MLSQMAPGQAHLEQWLVLCVARLGCRCLALQPVQLGEGHPGPQTRAHTGLRCDRWAEVSGVTLGSVLVVRGAWGQAGQDEACVPSSRAGMGGVEAGSETGTVPQF